MYISKYIRTLRLALLGRILRPKKYLVTHWRLQLHRQKSTQISSAHFQTQLCTQQTTGFESYLCNHLIANIWVIVTAPDFKWNTTSTTANTSACYTQHYDNNDRISCALIQVTAHPISPTLVAFSEHIEYKLLSLTYSSYNQPIWLPTQYYTCSVFR